MFNNWTSLFACLEVWQNDKAHIYMHAHGSLVENYVLDGACVLGLLSQGHKIYESRHTKLVRTTSSIGQYFT